MKLTKSQLKEMIREAVREQLSETANRHHLYNVLERAYESGILDQEKLSSGSASDYLFDFLADEMGPGKDGWIEAEEAIQEFMQDYDVGSGGYRFRNF